MSTLSGAESQLRRAGLRGLVAHSNHEITERVAFLIVVVPMGDLLVSVISKSGIVGWLGEGKRALACECELWLSAGPWFIHGFQSADISAENHSVGLTPTTRQIDLMIRRCEGVWCPFSIAESRDTENPHVSASSA